MERAWTWLKGYVVGMVMGVRGGTLGTTQRGWNGCISTGKIMERAWIWLKGYVVGMVMALGVTLWVQHRGAGMGGYRLAGQWRGYVGVWRWGTTQRGLNGWTSS